MPREAFSMSRIPGILKSSIAMRSTSRDWARVSAFTGVSVACSTASFRPDSRIREIAKNSGPRERRAVSRGAARVAGSVDSE